MEQLLFRWNRKQKIELCCVLCSQTSPRGGWRVLCTKSAGPQLLLLSLGNLMLHCGSRLQGKVSILSCPSLALAFG